MSAPIVPLAEVSVTDPIVRLRKALDVNAMAEHFAANRLPVGGAGRAVGCEVTRVHPRGSRGFVIAYDLQMEGSGRRWVESLQAELVPGDAEAHCRAVASRLGDGAGSHLPYPSNHLVACVPDPGLVLRRPATDEALAGLRMLDRPGEVGPILSATGIVGPGAADAVSVQLLGHRLGKRAVLRLYWRASQQDRQTSFSVIAKLFKRRSNKVHSLCEAMGALRRDGLDGSNGVRVPEVLGQSTGAGAVLLEDIPGTPLPELAAAELPSGMALAGRALARLHLARVAGLKTHGVEDELDLLEAWVDLVGGVRPELRSLVETGLATVRAALSRVGNGPAVVIHRDFHLKQVLLEGETAVLTDFDTLCTGDPALDVGNFLAHLRLTDLQSGGDLDAQTAAFLGAYGAAATGDLAVRIVAYERAALLRLACLYSLSTRWAQLARPLLRGLT
ncbi:MAG: phosphotransferase [Inquilinus sp.]|nr:phosphotransferase [Inquilinus sp.]